MPFEIVRNNIVNIKVDAIVNTANPKPIVGGGVDSEIHKGAGSELLIARKKIGDIGFGKAFITSAYNLKAKYVIHTSTPSWEGGYKGEGEILSDCIKNSLNLAKEKGCDSIAMPLIGTGTCGYPSDLALQITIKEVSEFLLKNEMHIYLAVFSKDAFSLSKKLFKSVKEYISENYVEEKINKEYIGSFRRKYSLEANNVQPFIQDSESIEDILKNLDEGFSKTLLRLIDNSGKTDPEVYKKANIDRKLFSKIKNNPDYRPSKTTAIAFALALELNKDGMEDLIGRAGYTLTRSSKFDVIIEYFIERKNYNIFEINEALFAFDQPLIGG